MATFMLEDQFGCIKCIAFPKSYTQIRDSLLPGKTLIVGGRLKNDEDKLEIIAENAIPPFKIYLRLPDSQDKALIDNLSEYLSHHIGDGELMLYYADLKQYSALPGIMGIMPDKDLINGLVELLGAKML